ncbi:MAG: putative importin subunit alpha-3 [Streblomastix strix]|uniref:Importin subunit alpha n=1 Tax=Streblomastix strix TaxID=222440 RepID=A0A5J4VZE7_9EUKA|nr:MAG: putative importin subunit alpha-3 [Streblomastix strix]
MDLLQKKRDEIRHLKKVQLAMTTEDQQILSNLDKVVEQLQDADQEQVLNSVRTIRKLLSSDGDEIPIQHVINSGAVEKLIILIYFDEYPRIQLESIWGVLQPMLHLLRSPDISVREQVVFALGNIANIEYIQVELISSGFEEMILPIICSNNLSIKMRENLCWLLSNLLQKADLKQKTIEESTRFLSQQLRNASEKENNEQLISDILWGLYFIAEKYNFNHLILQYGILMIVIRYMRHHNLRLIIPALRIVGELASGSELDTQSVVNAGALDALNILLQKTKLVILKESCWVLSNIAAGTSSQVDALLQSGCIQRILALLHSSQVDCFNLNKQENSHPVTLPQITLNSDLLQVKIIQQQQQQKEQINKDENDSEDDENSSNQNSDEYMDAKSQKKNLNWQFDAIFTISNISHSSLSQAAQLGSWGTMQILAKFLDSKHTNFLRATLEAIINILGSGRTFAVGKTNNQYSQPFHIESQNLQLGTSNQSSSSDFNPFPQIQQQNKQFNINSNVDVNSETNGDFMSDFEEQFAEHDGVEKLEQLLSHKNKDVRLLAQQILDKFYPQQELEENTETV